MHSHHKMMLGNNGSEGNINGILEDKNLSLGVILKREFDY